MSEITQTIEANASPYDPGSIDRVMSHFWADHLRGKIPSPKPHDSIEADAIHNLGFIFLERLGWENTGNGQYRGRGRTKTYRRRL